MSISITNSLVVRQTVAACALALLLFSFSTIARAESSPVNKGRNSNVAISGIDAVSYRQTTQGFGPSQGDALYEVKHAGAIWRFASKVSSERFAANPEQFTPAYGGFCANALALGEGLIPTSGQHWEIFGDQLYLFFAPRGRTRWLDGNWEEYKRDADAAWKQEQ